MNNIRGINSYMGPQAIRAGSNSASKADVTPTGSATGKEDKVEISQIAHFLNKISQMPDIRQEKVDEIRKALADGSYDIDGKLPLALDSFLEDYWP